MSLRIARLAVSAPAIAATLAFASAAQAATEPLGVDALQTYNLIVLGNLTSSSEVEGRTFVGGSLEGNSSNYLISSAVPSSSFTGPGLTVVGDVNGGTKNLNNSAGAYVGGSVSSGFNLNGTQTVKVGGTISNTNVNSSTVTSGLGASDPGFVQNLQQYASAMGTSMNELSYRMGKAAPTGTLSISGNRGTFNAVPGSDGVAVFNISAADLDAIGEVQFNLNGADTVIVNVSGASVNLNDNFLGGTANLGEHVVWNFKDATDLTLTTSWGGSVLAPKAAAHTFNYIQGSAVFGSLIQDGEMHIGTYLGSYTPPSDPGSSSSTSSSSSSSGGTQVPEPGMLGLMGAGLAGLAWSSRRKRKMA